MTPIAHKYILSIIDIEKHYRIKGQSNSGDNTVYFLNILQNPLNKFLHWPTIVVSKPNSYSFDNSAVQKLISLM